MPGQIPGISPVQAPDKKSSTGSVRRESSPLNGGLDKKPTASSLRKEVEKRSSTPESLSTIVTRSFQKERGERRAPDLSNVLPAVAQRVGRLKKEGKSEPNSAENSPRYAVHHPLWLCKIVQYVYSYSLNGGVTSTYRQVGYAVPLLSHRGTNRMSCTPTFKRRQALSRF